MGMYSVAEAEGSSKQEFLKILLYNVRHPFSKMLKYIPTLFQQVLGGVASGHSVVGTCLKLLR